MTNSETGGMLHTSASHPQQASAEDNYRCWGAFPLIFEPFHASLVRRSPLPRFPSITRSHPCRQRSIDGLHK